MKNSIGSLSALAAFAIPAALDASTQVAAFENVDLPYQNSGTVDFDLDGDSTPDFYVFSNSIFVGLEASLKKMRDLMDTQRRDITA